MRPLSRLRRQAPEKAGTGAAAPVPAFSLEPDWISYCWRSSLSGFNPSTGAYVVPAGQGGLWSIGMGLTFGTQSTRRAIGITIGGTWLWREEGPATGYSELSFARVVELAAGATLQPRLYCAAAVSIRGDQNGGAYFQVRRVE